MPDSVTPPRPRVVVVGSYAVGLVMRAARIPARGETVLGHSFQRMHGGKGSNQAIASARLGAHTSFIAALGFDADGDAALALHRADGVDVSQIRQISGVPTGVGFITVDDAGDNAIAVDLGANLLLSPEAIDAAEAEIAAADVLLVQLEIPPATALHAMRIARRHGVLTILNPAPAVLTIDTDLSSVDILTPNLSEARALTGLRDATPAALGEALRARGVATVVVTVGEHGAWLVDRRGATTVPALAVDAIDTTGAGDAFSAALAVALAEGIDLDSAVPFACAAGAYSVRTAGTVPSYSTRRELARFLESFR